MKELITQLSKKTGLPEAQARQAAEFVIRFIKDRLPAPIASQVDAAVAAGGGADIPGISSKITGMFGGK